MIKSIHTIAILMALFITSLNTYAFNEQERIYLVQLMNQLNAMKPIILAAQKAQNKDERVPFHYTKWRDAQGVTHAGLLEDIEAIKLGVMQKLDQVEKLSGAPRTLPPIQGDYLSVTGQGIW